MSEYNEKEAWLSLVYIIIIFIVVLIYPFLLNAESSYGSNDEVSASLRFKIIIKQSLYLRIGSEGTTVDTVKFETTNTPEGQETVMGDISPEIKVAAIVSKNSNITLTVDSSSELRGENQGNFIPLSKISSTGTGDFGSINNKTFDGSNNQTVWSDTGGGIRSGVLKYAFNNSEYYQADTYVGQVVYTLSSP